MKTLPEQKILALDLGTKFGWAYQDEAGAVRWGTERLVKRKGRPGKILRDFEFWLMAHLITLAPDVVVFENVRRHRGVLAAHAFGAWRCVVLMKCDKLDVPVYEIEVPRIKMVASGKGNATKSEMIEAVCNLGFAVDDEDAADAVAILYTYRQTRKLETS